MYWLNFTYKGVLEQVLEWNNKKQAIFINQIADQVSNPNMFNFEDKVLKDKRILAHR